MEQTLNLKHLSVRYTYYIIVMFTYYITTTFLEILKCFYVLKPNNFFTLIAELIGILLTVFFIPYYKRVNYILIFLILSAGQSRYEFF